MAKLFPLFSSSSGNSTYMEIGSDAVLVDCGASFKAIKSELEKNLCEISKIKAVAVTHEHIDHVKGLRVLLKNLNVPLIASSQTAEALIKKNLIPEGTNILTPEKEICVGDIALNRFATSHDCAGSSGFTLQNGSTKLGLCTDLGIMTNEIITSLSNSSCVLIESNHDIEMLKVGPYPPELKLRIMSDKGHLSNIACAVAISELLKRNVNRFVLGHLSEKNNTPVLAEKTNENFLLSLGAKKDDDYLLSVAKKLNNGVNIL